MFENDKELLPAIRLYGIEILEFDFKENFCTINNIGNDIDLLYCKWKKELLTTIKNL